MPGWDEIADRNHMEFLAEGIHLNKKGALVVTDLIVGFLSAGQ